MSYFSDTAEARRSYYSAAVDAYERQDYRRCASLLERSIAVSRDSAAVLLREQATCYGFAREYQKQLNALVKARKAAERIGRDSVAREASISIGNVYSYCTRDSVKCEINAATRNAASWPVPYPLLIVLVCLAVIGLVYVISTEPSEQ